MACGAFTFAACDPAVVAKLVAGRATTPVDGSYSLYTVRADGTDLRRIYNGDSMRNHAHVRRNRVIFSEFTQDLNGDGHKDERDLGASEIGVMGVDGLGYELIASRPGYNITPDWSPDGNAFVFSSDRENSPGVLDLFRYDMSSGIVTNLTQTPGASEGDPRWSGNTIVFNRITDGVASIWAMNDDGSGQRQLTPPSFGRLSTGVYPFGDFDPALSADGRHVAFERHTSDGVIWQGMDIGRWNLVVRDLATGAERVVAGGTSVDASPAWSPDGSTVAYWELLPQSFSLFAYTLADDQVHEILAGSPGMQAEMPDWYYEGDTLRLIFSAHSG
jgi:TolB protein